MMLKRVSYSVLYIAMLVGILAAAGLYAAEYRDLIVNPDLGLTLNDDESGAYYMCATEQLDASDYGNCWPVENVIDMLRTSVPDLFYSKTI